MCGRLELVVIDTFHFYVREIVSQRRSEIYLMLKTQELIIRRLRRVLSYIRPVST